MASSLTGKSDELRLIEAAEYLTTSVTTLRKWTNAFRIPRFKASGRTGTVTYKKSDLDAFRDSRRDRSGIQKSCVNCLNHLPGDMCGAQWTHLVTGTALDLPPMTCSEARASQCGVSGEGFVWKTKK